MAGVLCVWVADLPDSSKQWYEDKYIPEMMSRHSNRVLAGDIIETGLDAELEGVANRDAAWKSIAVYEVENAQETLNGIHDKSNHPCTFGEPLQSTRFDIRAYEEIRRWQEDDEWNGDSADVAIIWTCEWQAREGIEKEVFEFYTQELGPQFSKAPEVLRLRLFKIKNAAVLKDDSCNTLENKDLHTYMSLIEMDCEEWPWDEIFAINSMTGWVEYFEGQKAVKWQASRYIVKRAYPG